MLTVSVAVFNPDLTLFEKFLQSLKKFTPELTQLLIFDNGSVSKDFAGLANKYFGPDVKDHSVTLKITHNDTNIGFGKAHNRNLLHAKSKYFSVMNDDVEFFENWAAPMIRLLEENQKIAQVGPKTKVFNTIAANNFGGWEDTAEPEYCEASCFIMPLALAKKYGLFNEEYQYGYFEDMDLSLRLKKDGYLLRNADVNWEHHRGSTTMKMIQEGFDLPGYYLVNEFLFKSRWHAYIMKKRFGKTIVVKRAGEIEDVFLTTPVIEALKEKYPDCGIILMTQNKEAVEGCFDIDGFAQYNSPVPCDLLIDLDYAYEKDFRSHIIDSFAKTAGVKVRKKTGTIYAENKNIEYVENLIKDYPEFVAVDFNDSIPGKEWKRENYIEICRRLKQDGFHIVTVGKTTKQHASSVDADLMLINVLSLQQAAIVISKSKLFLGNEGLLAHYAQTMQVPHVVLYGCTLPEYVSDTSLPNFYPLVTPVSCRGCRHRHAAGTIVICPRNHVCMESFSLDTVYQACKDMLAAPKQPAEDR